MTISNTAVVDTTLKYIVKSTGIKDEDNQIMVDAEKLKDGTIISESKDSSKEKGKNSGGGGVSIKISN